MERKHTYKKFVLPAGEDPKLW